LQQLLLPTPESGETTSPTENEQNQYHPHFYQQLPNFIMALLNNQPQAALHYAPLLYHLVSCSTCQAAYLDLYTAMQSALQPDQQNLTLTQKLSPSESASPRIVAYLSRFLVHQAEAVLRQAHREHTDNTQLARSLLQQAIHISSHITQNHLRSQALQDLIRVATLYESSSESTAQKPALHSYTPLIARGTTARRADTSRSAETPTGQHIIHLQSAMLEGAITQQGDTLELHLHNLDLALRGHHLTISIPLGSLIEPVRWLGGNPKTIRSITPVDQHGTLNTLLGQTDLQLSNPEERNILEATFMLLEIRPAD
jgi:hypothetical protein